MADNLTEPQALGSSPGGEDPTGPEAEPISCTSEPSALLRAVFAVGTVSEPRSS